MRYPYAVTVLATVALACCASSGLCETTRFAVIDVELALVKFRGTQKANAEIERQKEEFRGQLAMMQKRLKQLEARFESDRKAALEKTLAGKEKKAKLAEAEKSLIRLKEYEHEMRMLTEKKRKELMDQSLRMRDFFLRKIRAAVREYAKKEGILAVIDASSIDKRGRSGVVYRDSSVDITAEIIRIINNKDAVADKSQKAKTQ